MYDRAPRVVSNTVGSTADHVGPGTYDGFVGDQKKLRTGESMHFCILHNWE